jgi:phosphatidylinositol alpha-mannosyltransferase
LRTSKLLILELKMRIAVFSYGLPVSGEKRGGIESVAHDLADGLARRGHHVTVWSYDPKPEDACYEVCGLPARRFFRTWLGQRLTMGYLGNFVALAPDYGDCEVLLVHGDSLLLSLKRIPVVRVVHGSALEEALSSRTLWRFLMQVGVYVQELLTTLTQSGCVANSYNALRFNPFIRHVIPLGTNLSDFFPDPAHKTPEPSILFVGAISGRKRGGLLIEWFERFIRRNHPNARMHMVSPPGPAVAGVTYHTGISRHELALLYRQAWVYASPSTYEGFGLPYVEAMASGTPVVATPNPGSDEVLDHGEFGRLEKDATFPQVVNDLLFDSEARERLAAKGLERAQRYSLTSMLASYEKLLAERCSPRHTHGRALFRTK